MRAHGCLGEQRFVLLAVTGLLCTRALHTSALTLHHSLCCFQIAAAAVTGAAAAIAVPATSKVSTGRERWKAILTSAGEQPRSTDRHLSCPLALQSQPTSALALAAAEPQPTSPIALAAAAKPQPTSPIALATAA